MSRITHFKTQPVNIQYWDYYILCHLNPEATLALQRMEFWDGTKDAGISHAEDINDMQALSGETSTQDVSPWIYKSQDELHWELMGIIGEKKLQKLIDFLVDNLKYLEARNNPYKGWDRKKQYEFKAEYIQEHINYLGYIVSYFKLPLRRLRPIFYAIEALTREGIYIDRLNVELVIKRVSDFRKDSKLPHFLKNDLEKLGEIPMNQPLRSFGIFAEWKAQNCGMHSAKMRNAFRKNADSIPQKCGSNSIEDRIENTKQRIQREERKNGMSQQTSKVMSKQEASHSFIHPSSSQNKNAFQETKLEEEVTLTEEEQAIYDFGRETIFKAKPPFKTPKLKSECTEIAKYVKTIEQFQNLVQFVCALPYIQGQIHLKNLVNELNGWLQSLEAKPAQASSSRGKPTGPYIAQQPTESEREAIKKRNEEQLAKMRARNTARAARQQEGAKA